MSTKIHTTVHSIWPKKEKEKKTTTMATRMKWYFVNKIDLTYSEKKLF
jgi:hypothetical protein